MRVCLHEGHPGRRVEVSDRDALIIQVDTVAQPTTRRSMTNRSPGLVDAATPVRDTG
jgi:hypothetical protein